MASTRRLGIACILCFTLMGVACSTTKTIVIATLFPLTGASATIGMALQEGVDIAAQQFAAGLGHGYVLAIAHVDESRDVASLQHDLAATSNLMGIIGPYASTTAQTLMPLAAKDGIATISPTNTLPGLTKADQAHAEGLAFATLHPMHAPTTYFRLPADDDALGKAAADLALAPTSANGTAAQSAFLVDDDTASGKAQAAAFAREFAARGGSVGGHQTLLLGPRDNAQAVTSAIIEAAPDVVFYGGDAAGGARLRDTLSVTGAPHLPLIAGGAVADDPDWGAAVGMPAAAAATMALSSAPGPAALTVAPAQNFIAAYQAKYGDTAILPQSVMAYDAAMTAINAIERVIAGGKDVTRSAVTAALLQTHYVGLTGNIAFDQHGDNTLAPGFALYSCDTNGDWTFKAQVQTAGS